MGRLTTEQLQQYRRDGFLIVEGVYSAAATAAALGAMDSALYGMPFEEWQAARDAGEPLEAKDGVA